MTTILLLVALTFSFLLSVCIVQVVFERVILTDATSAENVQSPLAMTIEYGCWLFLFLIIFSMLFLGGAWPLVRNLLTGTNGATGLMRPLPFSLFLSAITTAVFFIGKRKVFPDCDFCLGRALHNGRKVLSSGFSEARTLCGTFKGATACILLTIIIVLLLRQILLFPPYMFDVLTYHLAPIPQWLESGSLLSRIEFSDAPHFDYANQNFLGLSLLNLIMVWITGDLTLVELPCLLFVVPLILLLYRLLRQQDMTSEDALFSTVAILSAPLVLFHLRNCKNYICYTVPWLSFTALLASNVARPSKKLLYLAIIPAALAWSFKIVCSFIIPPVIVLFIAGTWLIHRKENLKLPIKETGKIVAILVLAIGAVSWLWIFKNYRDYNSYYPRILTNKTGEFLCLTNVNHIQLFDTSKLNQNIPFAKNFMILGFNIFQYPFRVLDYPFASWDMPSNIKVFVGNCMGTSNFGALYFAFGQIFGLAGLYFVLKSRDEKDFKLKFFVVAGVIVLGMHWGAYFNLFSYRSHMFFYLMAMIVAARGFLFINPGGLTKPMVLLASFIILLHLGWVLSGEAYSAYSLNMTLQKPVVQRSSAGYSAFAERTAPADAILPQVSKLAVNLSPPDLVPLYGYGLSRQLVEFKYPVLSDTTSLWEKTIAENPDYFFVTVTSDIIDTTYTINCANDTHTNVEDRVVRPVNSLIRDSLPWTFAPLRGSDPEIFVLDKHLIRSLSNEGIYDRTDK